MKNYVAPGNVMPAIVPEGGVKSGDVLLVGTLIGVCSIDAAEGAQTELQLVGVFSLPKVPGAIDAGAAVYWSGTAVTVTAGTNVLLGAAMAAAGADDPTVAVRLIGSNTAAAA